MYVWLPDTFFPTELHNTQEETLRISWAVSLKKKKITLEDKGKVIKKPLYQQDLPILVT